MEKRIGNYHNGLYRGYIGIMENKMETTIKGLGFSLGSKVPNSGYYFQDRE